MNHSNHDLGFLELARKASSKHFVAEDDDFESQEHNPENDFELGLLDLPSGVWRTNLFIEGE